MSIMSRIVKWIINIGVKFITKLVRTASEMSGTPRSRLPTEKDVIWELGSTVAKKMVKAKCSTTIKTWWSKIVTPFRDFVDRCRGILPLKDRVSYDDGSLVIDV